MNVLASFRRRRPLPEYRPPDGSYRATAAPLSRRALAGLLDWTIVTVCFLIAQIPLGVLQATADEIGGVVFAIVFALTQAVALAIVAGYFAFFFSTGHTLGMRATDIHLVAAGSGASPSLARSAARGVLAVVFFVTTFTAYTFVLGRYDTPLSTFHQVSRAVCISVAALAFFGHLWQLWDRNGRSLWDRLFGLAAIEDRVPSSMPDRLWTPWGT
jgi:uncharacterized RDD family membrane protein YckC